MSNQEIIIVGAGPAGLTVALNLSQHNIPFTIIDKQTENKQHSRATGIQKETLCVFENLGIKQQVQEQSVPIHGSQLYWNNQKKSYTPFTKKGDDPMENISINQIDVEQIMISTLKQYGTKILWETPYEQKDYKDNPIIIACDGSKSQIRKNANIAFTGEKDKTPSFSCDALVQSTLDNSIMHQMIFPDARLVFVPLPKDKKFRITGTIPTGSELNSASITSLVNELSAIDIKDVSDINRYHLNMKKAERLGIDRFLLVGDAAQTFYPNGGFGLNTAIQQADILANIIIKTPRENHGTSKILEDYERAVNPIITERMNIAKRLKEKTSPRTISL